jgi:hypothetical protein
MFDFCMQHYDGRRMTMGERGNNREECKMNKDKMRGRRKKERKDEGRQRRNEQHR